MKEFDGNVDKLVAEYQHDTGIETRQPSECNQELKDCASDPRRMLQRVLRQDLLRSRIRVQGCLRESLREWIRVCLRAERECYVVRDQDQNQIQDQPNVDNGDCAREQTVRISVALSEVCGGTQLTRGELRTCATGATETDQFYLCRLEKFDVRIGSWEARVIQLE